MNEQTKAALIIKYTSNRKRLTKELRRLVDAILDDAAENGTEAMVITFSDDCSRYGSTGSDIITGGLASYLGRSGFQTGLSDQGRLRCGNIIYTINNDGTFVKSTVDPEKEYNPMFLITWPE
jgi:hypothetical protein